MKIVVIDGQGGKMGRTVIEQLKSSYPYLEIYAIGTNSIATAAMLKAGANYGAPAMAAAIASCKAYKILIPVNRCNHLIIGCKNCSLTEYISMVCEEVGKEVAKYENR